MFLPLLSLSRHFEKITYFFLLILILITFVTLLLLGGLVTSMGLIFVGLTCALSSVLLNRAKLTIQLFMVYAGTIVTTALLQPYLVVPAEITPGINLLFYVLNILWITGSTLIFILVYIHQQSKIEAREASRLKELDEAKTKLYTNITHEFRTPLTIILGMTVLVEKKPGKWLQKGIREIRLKAKTLLLMVNQMLELAQLESGLLSKKLVNGDIIRYLKYLTESFASTAEHRKIELHFKSPVEKFNMDFDTGKLSQIFSNLLSNAFKFTSEGGRIEVNARPEDNMTGQNNFFIEVKDSGIGMKEEYLDHIFDRFYRIQDDQGYTSAGSGLGLAYTKELVSLLGGRISVNSQPGKGSVFSIRLPVTREAGPEKNDYPDLSESLAPYQVLTERTGQSKKIKKVIPADRPVLLIVEDNPDVINYLIEILENRYRIEVASNGKEGLESAFRTIPDIVISDVMMPVMDGFQFLENLRKDIRTSHIPVILLTAKADDQSRLEGLERGADAYLSKPFHQEELFIRLDKLIQIRKKIQQYLIDIQQGKPIQEVSGIGMEIDFMQKIRNILEKNLQDEEFGIEALCREIPMSRTQLYRKFSALTDQTLSKYIRTIRLRKAKDLLIHHNVDVSEAAYRSGFKNLSHFSSSFKEEFGIAPSKIAGRDANIISRDK
jgi:signal transduction histidine kinase/DNA-binding response OmpR family regulator